jgi:hypothetical protein
LEYVRLVSIPIQTDNNFYKKETRHDYNTLLETQLKR